MCHTNFHTKTLPILLVYVLSNQSSAGLRPAYLGGSTAVPDSVMTDMEIKIWASP